MFLFILYLQNANEQLLTDMKAQLVTSLGIAGSCVTFSERLYEILFLRPAVIVNFDVNQSTLF